MKNQIEKISSIDVKGYEELVNFTKKIFDKGFSELSDVINALCPHLLQIPLLAFRASSSSST